MITDIVYEQRITNLTKLVNDMIGERDAARAELKEANELLRRGYVEYLELPTLTHDSKDEFIWDEIGAHLDHVGKQP